ncbi:deoxyhypusine synthase family protein [Candidatus Bathyarchaeota archaeon]|nr:deoxyhypusine synthase family protein [Candidatus Bathyarchaeota archaeon]
MPKKYLDRRIVPIDLEKVHKVSDVLSAFRDMSFQARTLSMCVEVYVKMLSDPENPVIFLGLSGAMIPAGMKKVVSLAVKERMIDVIVTTGANAYHDFVESLGFYHYKGSPHVDDSELYKLMIDRIYDTFVDEECLQKADSKILMLAEKIREKFSDLPSLSSREFMFELGRFIDEEGLEEEKESSFLWNCWKYKVPVFVPALNDSSIGLSLTKHYATFVQRGLTPLIIDPIKDNFEIYKIKKAAKKTGVIYIGGGVPKNYIQQTAYLERSLLGIEDSGHDYGFQVTTDRPEWGGLSGCTFKESLSWGKIKDDRNFVTCYCDATIAFPLIVKAVLERMGEKLRSRSRLDLDF